ncbi:sel1 repeat family protein, partial [Rhizobium sp. AQ_MP]|nr:sel1 repeat family protein [Rhizobium sp. AQ_MP]
MKSILHHEVCANRFVVGLVAAIAINSIVVSSSLAATNSPATDGARIAELEKRALENDAGALTNLGDIYSRGGPVPIDGPKAIDYYTRAAELGNTGALVRLGEIYRDGVLVAAD